MIEIKRMSTRDAAGFFVKVFGKTRFAYMASTYSGGFTSVLIGGKLINLESPAFLVRAYWKVRPWFPMFYYVNLYCCDTQRTHSWYKDWSYSPASNRRLFKDAAASTDGPCCAKQISFYKWLKLDKYGRY